MRAVISILLAGIVAVHSAGGLCWQCVDVQASCPKSPVAATGCTCHRAAEAPSDGEGVGDSDSSCEFECAGTCRYLQTERVSVEQPDMPWIATLSLDHGTIPSQSVFDIFERSAIARGSHPPLRLHLFHGLLLI